MDYLDALIEESAISGELSSGTPVHWLAKQADPRLVTVLAAANQSATHRSASWSPDEENFVRQNLGPLGIEETARQMGRSVNSVKIYWTRYLDDVAAPSKRAEWPTAHKVAKLMGIGCCKSVILLMRLGLLPGRVLPGKRNIHVVHYPDLVRFAVNPENWIYFNPDNVRDLRIKRLIALRRQRWGDEWWSTGQVAAYHGVCSNDVTRFIYAGKLPAYRWGNWWVKRSDATAKWVYFPKGKGSGVPSKWTPAAEAFLILARAVGFSWVAIEAMSKLKNADAHMVILRRRGRIGPLIQQYGLHVDYDPVTGRLWADWSLYQTRFPKQPRVICMRMSID